MERFARLLLVTLGFGALGFVVSLVPQKNATGAAGAPVNIVSSIPLSVGAQQSGMRNVGITGTPSVNAAITNSSLPVSGTVTVGNTSANPLLTQSVGTLAANAFFKAGTCTFAPSAFVCTTFPTHLLTVAPGATAVITYASGDCSPDAGSGPFSAALDVSGNPVDIAPSFNGATGQTQFGLPLELYIPGSASTVVDPQMIASVSQSGGETCHFVLSGYFAANGATS